MVFGFTSNVVVLGWIWRGEPIPDIFLQFVTYEAKSVPIKLQLAGVMAHVSSCLSGL